MSCCGCNSSTCNTCTAADAPAVLTNDIGLSYNIVKADADLTLDSVGYQQVHVTTGGPTITLPQTPRIGDMVEVVACGDNCTVTGGTAFSIAGGNVVVSINNQNRFTFSMCCEWVAFTPAAD